jgi:hypothetical protein
MSRTVRLALLFALVLLVNAPAGAQNALLKDLVFTAVQPCRIYDTRAGSGVQGQGTGPIAAGQTRDIDVSHGAAPSCGIPSPQARATVMNFVAVGPAGPGHLIAWPFGTTMPNASILNYANVGGLNIANGLVMTICSYCTHDLSLSANVSATHVVIDVLGYFAAPGTGPLWGRGRPGTKMWGPGDFFCVNGSTVFGLSDIAVTWGSAADACPQGTWVCTATERGTASCDTSRPDSVCDALQCDATCINYSASTHIGWVADQGNGTSVRATGEGGGPFGLPGCYSLSVWCCTE